MITSSDDYFVRGHEDTYVFRCLLRRGPNRFDGIALSEISIWGRTGPWEIFSKDSNGDFTYVETGGLPNTACRLVGAPGNHCPRLSPF